MQLIMTYIVFTLLRQKLIPRFHCVTIVEYCSKINNNYNFKAKTCIRFYSTSTRYNHAQKEYRELDQGFLKARFPSYSSCKLTDKSYG